MSDLYSDYSTVPPPAPAAEDSDYSETPPPPPTKARSVARPAARAPARKQDSDSYDESTSEPAPAPASRAPARRAVAASSTEDSYSEPAPVARAIPTAARSTASRRAAQVSESEYSDYSAPAPARSAARSAARSRQVSTDEDGYDDYDPESSDAPRPAKRPAASARPVVPNMAGSAVARAQNQAANMPARAGSAVSVSRAASGIVGLTSINPMGDSQISRDITKSIRDLTDPTWRRMWCCGNLWYVALLIMLIILAAIYAIVVVVFAFITPAPYPFTALRSVEPLSHVGPIPTFEGAKLLTFGPGTTDAPVTPADTSSRGYGSAVAAVKTLTDTFVAVGTPSQNSVEIYSTRGDASSEVHLDRLFTIDISNYVKMKDDTKGSFGSHVAISEETVAVYCRKCKAVYAFTMNAFTYAKDGAPRPMLVATIATDRLDFESLQLNMVATNVVGVDVVSTGGASRHFRVKVPVGAEMKKHWPFRVAGFFFPIPQFKKRGYVEVALTSSDVVINAAGTLATYISPSAATSVTAAAAATTALVHPRASDLGSGSALVAAEPVASANGAVKFKLHVPLPATDDEIETYGEDYLPLETRAVEITLSDEAGHFKTTAYDLDLESPVTLTNAGFNPDLTSATPLGNLFARPVSVRALWVPEFALASVNMLGKATPAYGAIHETDDADIFTYVASKRSHCPYDPSDSMLVASTTHASRTFITTDGVELVESPIRKLGVNKVDTANKNIMDSYCVNPSANQVTNGNSNNMNNLGMDFRIYQNTIGPGASNDGTAYRQANPLTTAYEVTLSTGWYYKSDAGNARKQLNTGSADNEFAKVQADQMFMPLDGEYTYYCPLTRVMVYWPYGTDRTAQPAVRVLRSCPVTPTRVTGALPATPADATLDAARSASTVIVAALPAAPNDNARQGCTVSSTASMSSNALNENPHAQAGWGNSYLPVSDFAYYSRAGITEDVNGAGVADDNCYTSSDTIVYHDGTSYKLAVATGVSFDEAKDFTSAGLRRRYDLTAQTLAPAGTDALPALAPANQVVVAGNLLVVADPDRNRVIVRHLMAGPAAAAAPTAEEDQALYQALDVSIAGLGTSANVMPNANMYADFSARITAENDATAPVHGGHYSCHYTDELARLVFRMAIHPRKAASAAANDALTAYKTTDKAAFNLPTDFFLRRVKAPRLTGTSTTLCAGIDANTFVRVVAPTVPVRVNAPGDITGVTGAFAAATAYTRPLRTDSGLYFDVIVDRKGAGFAEMVAGNCNIEIPYEGADGNEVVAQISMISMYSANRLTTSSLLNYNYHTILNTDANNSTLARYNLCSQRCDLNVNQGRGTCVSTIVESGPATKRFEAFHNQRGCLYGETNLSTSITGDHTRVMTSPVVVNELTTHNGAVSDPAPALFKWDYDMMVTLGNSDKTGIFPYTYDNIVGNKLVSSQSTPYFNIMLQLGSNASVKPKDITRATFSFPYANYSTPTGGFFKSFTLKSSWAVSTCPAAHDPRKAKHQAPTPYWYDVDRFVFTSNISPNLASPVTAPGHFTLFRKTTYSAATTQSTTSMLTVSSVFPCGSEIINLYLGYLVFGSAIGVVVVLLLVVIVAPALRRRYEESVRTTRHDQDLERRQRQQRVNQVYARDKNTLDASQAAMMQDMDRAFNIAQQAGDDENRIWAQLRTKYGDRNAKLYEEHRARQNVEELL